MYLQQCHITKLEHLLESSNKTLKAEQNENKNAALTKYRKEVRHLQKKQVDLQSSVETWQRRFDLTHPLTLPWHSIYPHTHNHTLPSHRRDEKKKSCQDLGLYKLAAVSKKKLMTENKKLKSKINTKFDKKAELVQQLNDSAAGRDYWEDQHAILKEEFEGDKHTHPVQSIKCTHDVFCVRASMSV